MINTKLKALLKEYQDKNTDITTSILSNIEHLVMNEVLQMPYFKDSAMELNGRTKNDLYIDEFENIVFYNGKSSLNTISKDDFVHSGGYVMTRAEAIRLNDIQEILENATDLSDLMNVFTEQDAILVQKFSIDLPRDELFSLMCMAKFKENLEANPNYELSFDEHYGKTMLRVYVEQACSIDKDFKYSVGQDTRLRNHLIKNEGVITQDSLSISTLKGIIRAENKTLANLCAKHLIDNPDAAISDHKEVYSDLSAIFKNPMIRENTVFGVLMDDTISGPEKLMKLYEKRYFEQVKVDFISMIDFQLNKPTVEDLTERYSNAVESIVKKIEADYPILNTARAETFYSEKSEFNYSKLFEHTRNKDSLLSRDYLEAERTLINATMDCYFSRQLDNVNLKLVERQQTDSFKMSNHQVVGYHNNIESTLLVRTQNFGGTDIPSKERPNITVLAMVAFPRELTNHAFDNLSVFIRDQEKLGMNVIINLKDVSTYMNNFTSSFEEMKKHPNVVICNYPSFENKLTKILEALHIYDVRNQVLTSEEKTSLLLIGLKRIETEFPNEINSYNYEGGQKVVDFMSKLIKEELPKLGNHQKIDNTLT